jgi:hypothetical protein
MSVFQYIKFIVPSSVSVCAVAALFFFVVTSVFAADDVVKEPWELAMETEVWEPVPVVVEAPLNAVPADAIALFDGKGLEQWESVGGGAASWRVEGGAMTVVPKAGDIRTKESFCDVQLHVEWRSPEKVAGKEGQGLGNSGVFLQERYEVQVLDSYKNKTYPNGQAASVYKQSIPLVNVTRAPGVWQSYDIIFAAPKFNEQKELLAPATVTVLHNGVLVQNHTEIQGPTEWIGHPPYQAHDCAPLRLQDHGDLVSFRNIWVRKL